MIACRTPAPEPIPVSMALEPPWAVVSQDAAEIALRFGTSGEGVRVWLDGTEGHVAGVSPVQDGRTLSVRDGAVAWPLVAMAFPERIVRAEIEVQGIDLVVRAYGPPIRDVTLRPDAPDDPVITWVRLRPRLVDWRIVVDGLGTVSLPAPSRPVEASEGGWTWTIDGALGPVALDTNAPAWTSAVSPVRWSFDTTPSLEAIQPYPRTGLTWTPGQ